MSKAKEISALWSQIKPQIGEMVRLCHEVESHYEVTADAYQRGYEEGYKDGYNEPGKGKIQVGDEVKGGDEKYIVLQKYLNNIDEPMAVLFNKRDGNIHQWHLYNANGAIFEKTGRHFSEIAEVLQKMKETDNG